MKFSFSSTIKTVLFAGVTALVSVSAHAGVILQAASATSNIGNLHQTPNATTNQSGLSANYISGVTDFDAFTATATTDCCNGSTLWAGTVGTLSAQVTYDLGSVFGIESMALWNRGLASQGIANFAMRVSNDASFATSTLIGNFRATAIVGVEGRPGAEVFNFSATEARYVRLNISSTYGSCCISYNEVAFEKGSVVAVPEPANIALFGLGLAGVGLVRRRRRAA